MGGNPLLAAYKEKARQDPLSTALPVTWRDRDLARLVPAMGELAAADLAKISEWRNAHREAFFSQRLSTPASTAAWLQSIEAKPDRILFFVSMGDGTVVGHIGLNGIDEAMRTAETDAWLGVGDARAPGVMLFGFATLLRWAFGYLRAERVAAQVFADNSKVLRAHESLGYRVEGDVPFERHEDASGVWWSPGDRAPTRRVTQLRLEREAFRDPGAARG